MANTIVSRGKHPPQGKHPGILSFSWDEWRTPTPGQVPRSTFYSSKWEAQSKCLYSTSSLLVTVSSDL